MKISENKSHSIHLRLTDSQYQYCFGNAEMMGVSVSDFLRMVINSLVVQQARQTEKLSQDAKRLADDMLGDLNHENTTDNK